MPSLGKDLIEHAGELGVAVPDEEPEGVDPIGEVHDQAAGLLGGPGSVRVGGYPRMFTRRVAISMTNSTYRRLRKTVSTVKKSHASRPSAWTRKNLRQEVSRPRGAGRQPRARRIRRTVASLTSWPRRVNSPCTRRYPHAGFSPASRSTRPR